MKKLLILVLLTLGVNIVYGQNTIIFNSNSKTNYVRLYSTSIIDSTLHDIDTTFTVNKNVVYRTIQTIFQEDSKDKEWRLIKYTTTFDGKNWNWNSMSIEKYYTFLTLGGTMTVSSYPGNYTLIGKGEVIIQKPKKKKK